MRIHPIRIRWLSVHQFIRYYIVPIEKKNHPYLADTVDCLNRQKNIMDLYRSMSEHIYSQKLNKCIC